MTVFLLSAFMVSVYVCMSAVCVWNSEGNTVGLWFSYLYIGSRIYLGSPGYPDSSLNVALICLKTQAQDSFRLAALN